MALSTATATTPPAASPPAREWSDTTATSTAADAPASTLVITETMPAIVAKSCHGPWGSPWMTSRRAGSPDHEYYIKTADRIGGNRACLALSRKLLKRSRHTLREVGEEALTPV